MKGARGGRDRAWKVAIVVPSFFSRGGIPEVAAFLHRAAEASGDFDPTIVSIATSRRDPESLRLLSPPTWARGVAVRSGLKGRLAYRHVGARFVEVEFQRYRPRRALDAILAEHDIVQVVAGIPSWVLTVRRAEAPVCLHVASLAALERERRLVVERGMARLWRSGMTAVTRRLELRGLKVPDAILVENPTMRDRLLRMGATHVLVGPPGVDTDRFRPGPSRASAGHILSVGRFGDPRKNVRLLLEAYAELLRAVPRAPGLTLVGARPGEDDARLMRELGVESRVRVLEGVPDDELPQLYRDAVLYVQSSDEEGFGMAIVEAMASGVPVVSTATDGPRLSVLSGVTGLLTPVGDARALSAAMASVLTDTAGAGSMGRAARERAERCFSYENAGRPYLETYRELLGAPG